jgi:hypothetical protein
MRTHHHRSELKAAPLSQALDKQRVMRTVGWLVGAALLVGGLTLGLRAQAATTASAASTSSSACTPATCGEVTAVAAHRVKGKGSGLGIVGGAVPGGYAGNEVEKNVNKHTVYKTSVRLGDGTVHEYTLSTQYAVGSKVSVVNGKVRSRQ